MIPTTRGLLLIIFIMSVWTVENEQTRPQRPAEATTPARPQAVLTEQRLEKYALCRESLDPLAIRAVLEAHGRIVHRIEASPGGMSLSETNRLGATSLPVYGDALVEWLLDEGRHEFEVELGDPFMEASSSPPQAGPAAAQLQAQAARCGLGSAAAYWETTRRIAAVLDYRPVDERFRRPGSMSANVERRRRAKRFEDLSSTMSAQDIGAEKAVLDRFLGRLGLCTTSAPAGATASRPVACWKGMAIAGAPCSSGLDLASTGYQSRDGICYAPSGRPDGPRLRTVCLRANEVRRDLSAYPVLCWSGVWRHVLRCAKDADCHPERYALPRSCKQGVCYAGKEHPILR
jgi:hypothetical protein